MSAFTACAKAYVRGNGGFYCFNPRQYEELLQAWRAGMAFYTGESLDGEELTIKLGEVEAILFCTPESQERGVERSQRESKAADSESFG